MLSTLHDAQGNTTITCLDSSRHLSGPPYPPEQFRSHAGVLAVVSLLGSGSVSDMLRARSAVTILGIGCPPVRLPGKGDKQRRCVTARRQEKEMPGRNGRAFLMSLDSWAGRP